MVSLRLAAALTAVGLFTSGMVFAEGAKPNDAQIAHIAYTAGQLDIEAAEQAKHKSENKDVYASRCSARSFSSLWRVWRAPTPFK